MSIGFGALCVFCPYAGSDWDMGGIAGMGGTWYAGDGESVGAGCAAVGAVGFCWYIGAFMVPGVMGVGVMGPVGAAGAA